MKKYLFIYMTLCIHAISSYANTFDIAVKHYLKHDYHKAFIIFKQLSNSGNINAQYNLGMMHYKGRGTPTNKVLAFIWFNTASKAGNKLAQNKLGTMYAKGEVVGSKEKIKATKEYLKSALQNYDIAQLNLGIHYNNNIKEESLKRAFFWYTKAAENGNLAAMNNLANMYYSAHAVKKDLKKAYELYFAAANEGDKLAQFNLSMMYYNGEYIKQSDKKALYWLELSAKAGLALAQVKLGTFYREGYNLVNKDFKKALYWYYEAAKQEWAEGEFYVGFSYFHGLGIKQSNKKAAYWMQKAKKHGYIHANTFMKRNNLSYLRL